jgi:two-component system chemotaxis sensor kinase CheA
VYALAVDDVRDHEELVVKPASPPVLSTGLYAGTTLAEDGRPVLLLDPSGLAAKAGISPTLAAEVEAEAAEAENEQPPRAGLLFTAFGGARRAVPLACVLRVEEVPAAAIASSGGRLHVAMEDRILPLAGCDAVPADGTVRIIRLSDGTREIAYAAADIIDTVALPATYTAVESPGEVHGVALVGAVQVELLDLHWLFASGLAAPAAESERPLCLLCGCDPWMDDFLRPLVESAGYRVRLSGRDGAGEAADLVILLDEAPDAVPAATGRVLRLRSAAGAGDEIYRYDRLALLSALRRQA